MLTGHCHCGALAYELDVDIEQAEGVFCNCRSCQILSTHRSYNVGAETSKLRWTKGEPTFYDDSFHTDSGQPIRRAFCSICATTIYSAPSLLGEACFVKVGTLDRAAEVKPVGELYVDTGLPLIALKHDFSGLKHFEGLMKKEVSV